MFSTQAPRRLTAIAASLSSQAMLQRNTGEGGAARAPNTAHWAHAAVVGVHVLCCGLPAAFAIFGVVLGTLAWAGPITTLHHWMHGYEAVILAFSAGMVALGGVLEWRRQGAGRGLRPLYALSVACFLANAMLVTSHWMAPTPAMAVQASLAQEPH